jgi:hypothetical protein
MQGPSKIGQVQHCALTMRDKSSHLPLRHHILRKLSAAEDVGGCVYTPAARHWHRGALVGPVAGCNSLREDQAGSPGPGDGHCYTLSLSAHKAGRAQGWRGQLCTPADQ